MDRKLLGGAINADLANGLPAFVFAVDFNLLGRPPGHHAAPAPLRLSHRPTTLAGILAILSEM
jgi:hypothetical protein